MNLKQFCVLKKISCFILIPLFAQAQVFDSWWWIFTKEKFSANRPYTHQLFSAVKSGDRAKAETALNKGASINARDRKGKTPLHWAVYKSDILMAEFLLQRGADPNAVNRRHRTPLHWAVLKPANELTLLLLKHGADPNIQDKRKRAPLHWLALKPNAWDRSIVREETSSKKIQNEYESPLYWNAQDVEKMRMLFSFKADPNLQDEHERAPLHYAVINDRLEIVDLLVENKADVNIKDWISETALHIISKRKSKPHSFAIAKLLLKNEADPNALNMYNISPMKFLAQNAAHELEALLSQFGGIVHSQNFCMRLFQKWESTWAKLPKPGGI